MKPDLQRRVQRYGWDKAASYYEPYWQQQLQPAQKRLLAMADLRLGERVLDVACGTGLVTLPAARRVGPGGTVWAVDLSDQMVDLVWQKARRHQLGQIVARRMDAEALGFSAQAFDAALCSLGLMYVPDPVQALREMHRVLVPPESEPGAGSGRVVAAVWGRRDRCGWAEIFPIVDRRVQSDVCPLFFQLGTGDALEAAFHAAGFAGITTERFATRLHYDTPEDACKAAFLGGAVALAYRRFDEATREGAHAEYLASIEPYRSDSGFDIPGEFVVAKGYRPGA
jgi:SAM-dependent methyltransferase